MNVFSLRTVIDDILLIVRNNNISESEDLSRDQIRAWVLAYKAYLAKKKHDKDEQEGTTDDSDDSMSTTVGPLALKDMGTSSTDPCSHIKRTVEKIPDLIGDSGKDLISVCDQSGCAIQLMNPSRRHYHYFRRYTYSEPSYRFDDGYIYVEGYDIDSLSSIYVEANFVEGPAQDEDDVQIPGWMIPDIKNMIFKNELSFMLERPSDDSNNSTLASVKPNGPQDKEE